MDYALNGVVKWLYQTWAALLNFISTSFLTTMGTSLKTFDTYFPFANTAFTVIQGFAFGLLLLIMVFQIFKNYLGPMTDAENPMFLLIKTCLFMVPLLASKAIYEWLLGIVGTPYSAIMNMGTPTTTAAQFKWSNIGNDIAGMVTGSATIGLLVSLVILFVLGWNFLKLVLEAAERYVIIGVLAYLAPLPFCTGASKATNNVFKSWCRMAASQLIMLILNVWSVKIVISSLDSFGLANGNVAGSYKDIGGVITWAICMFAFLKIAQKLDAYMAQIGMSTAQTGGSLLEEVIVAGQGVKAVLSAAGGVASRAMTGSAAGGVLGALGASPAMASSMRSMFGGAAGTPAGAAAAAAVTGAGIGDAVGNVPSSGIGNGGTQPSGGGGKGGKATTGGALGGLAQRVAVNRFNSGLRESDASKGSYGFATNTISNIARGDSRQVGTLSDNINAATPEAQSMGSRAYNHYFGQKYTDAAKGVSGVTMGDGHISGLENGQHFDMYSADKYHAPDGDYTTQAAQDGSSWYKVMSPETGAGAAGAAGASGGTGASGGAGASGSGGAAGGTGGSGFNAAKAASRASGSGGYTPRAPQAPRRKK